MEMNKASEITRIMAQSVLQTGEIVNEKSKSKRISDNKKLLPKSSSNSDEEVQEVSSSQNVLADNLSLNNFKLQNKEKNKENKNYNIQLEDPKLGKKINIET